MARTSAAQSAEHEARLLAAGRKAFLASGFFEAMNDDIARCAGLTRGALHYRYGDKRGLFLAVIRKEAEDLAARLYARTMAAAPSELGELAFGGDVLLAELSGPETGRLLLELAPAVLTAKEHETLVEKLPLELIEHALGHWADTGALTPDTLPELARALWGAVRAAALAVRASDDGGRALARHGAALRLLTERLVGQG